MPGSVLQSDFTAGELAPSLSARVDLAKYTKGCRTLTNFLVQAHGGAVKRPGFVLLDSLPGEAVLIPFVFSQSQAYCLVFGDGWLRVATHDGFILDGSSSVYKLTSPYTLAQAKELSYAQSADVLFLAVHGVAPTKLKRYGHANWQFETMVFTEPLPSPTTQTATLSGGSGSTPYTYYVTAINADGKESGLPVGISINGPPSNNWTAGTYIEVTWSAVTNAVEYRVYKASFGGRPGFVTDTKNLSWRDFNVTPSTTEGAPVYENPFPAADYPGAVCLFEQRLVFASSPNRPQTIWMSKTGDYGNFATYKPAAADTPIELTIASQEVSPVNWLVPLRSLIVGAGGMEWEISSRADSSAFSASNAKASPQSYWGSSLRNAIIIGNVVLHVSSSGRQVRSLQYVFSADSYDGSDLSIMAAHLLESGHVIDWTYAKAPDSIVWAVRSDGMLLGLTFQAEHEIVAWHKHSTQGKFKSVCAIPNGTEDALFALVERNGVMYLERAADRYLGGDPTGAVFLDASLTYRGDAVSSVTGLEHLNGMEVGIFADGAVQTPRVVSEGRVTLDSAASVVTVGLQYTADLETMPVEIVGQNGTSVAQKKQINGVNVMLRDSLGVKIGPSFEDSKMQEVKWRTTEPYGQPPAPYTGLKNITMPTLADNIVTVCLRSEMPTPVTVLSLVSRMTVNQ